MKKYFVFRRRKSNSNHFTRGYITTNDISRLPNDERWEEDVPWVYEKEFYENDAPKEFRKAIADDIISKYGFYLVDFAQEVVSNN